jgi:ABC-type lipoprotein export system ATPase subunit
VLDALGRAAADGASCLIATHNVALAPRLDRVLEMADGRVSIDGEPERRGAPR